MPAPEDYADCENYVAHMTSMGMSRQDAIEQYREACAEVLRPWRQLNAFRTDQERLECWLVERLLDFFRDSPTVFTPFDSSSDLLRLIGRVRPFTMVWFELWILRGLIHASELEERADKDVFGLCRNGIATGRLIEAYRWRFVYGAHALRGQKVLRSAADGGRSRSQAMRAENVRILNQISQLLKRGHSVSRAAENSCGPWFRQQQECKPKTLVQALKKVRH